jgi:uncharacterized protein YceH (UPF0502 family)
MLRGPQTVGEIKTRTARLYEFADLAAVEATLDGLIERQAAALVARLPRRPGQKEIRFAHLLSGEPPAESTDAAGAPEPTHSDRVEVLEQSVDALRAEVAELRARFEEFRREFQ